MLPASAPRSGAPRNGHCSGGAAFSRGKLYGMLANKTHELPACWQAQRQLIAAL